MSTKNKERYPCNLLKIREELGLTQEQLGDILEVGARMICNYETGETTLPIEKAIVLSKRYNYTLDWIYSNPMSDNKTNLPIQKKFPKFYVNLKEFISYSNDSIHFTIPSYYMEYIKERNTIESSKEPREDKKRRLAELDGKYSIPERETKYWRISLKKDEISSYLRFDSEFIPFADCQDDSAIKPTEEQMEEVLSFFKKLLTDGSEAFEQE